jgi:hypothetical protein
MKIEIEISDACAALLKANQFQPQRVELRDIIERLANRAADEFRQAFPEEACEVIRAATGR